MKREARNHSKMRRLCRKLDVPLYQAMGILECLWHLTAVEAWRGDIGKLSNEDIALALDYRGDEDQLIEALVATGWLDKDETCRLLVHDWAEHADNTVQKRAKRAIESGQVGFYPPLSGHVRTIPSVSGHVRTIPSVSSLPEPEPEPSLAMPEIQNPAPRAPKARLSAFEIPSWIPPRVWADFEEMRKKIRAPMTDRAREGIVDALQSLRDQGYAPEEVLVRSIVHAWKGVFPLNDTNANSRHPPAQAVKILSRPTVSKGGS